MTTYSETPDYSPAEIVQQLKRNATSGRSIFNMTMTAISGLFTLLAIIPLIAVLGYVLLQGAQRLDLDLFTQLPPPPGNEPGGLGNAIVGTLIVVGISMLIAVPLGVMTSIYLSEFAYESKLAEFVRFATNVLAGVPSIIGGTFIYGLLIVSGVIGYSAVAGGIALTVTALPIIIRTTDEALSIVSKDIRYASFGIGATNYQTILRVVLPAALPSIITGIVLAVARTAGETASLIFTALNSFFWPRGVFEPIATLSVNVYNFAIVPFANQRSLAWAGSLILVLLVLLTSITARFLTRQKKY